ncbi:MAG: helix-turn-helix transcriptional regulator [Clostridia bacterium]|nr:helix-turn-helix transcriptional regulator [Clostridia bacterium]
MLSKIKRFKRRHDLAQKEIADILGIDQRVYSNYETGKREIPTRLLIILADYYNTSTDYILGRTNNIRPYETKHC